MILLIFVHIFPIFAILPSISESYLQPGKVRNRGWELAANYFDQKGDWAWQAGFSLSGVKNEITDMKGVEDHLLQSDRLLQLFSDY